MRTLKISSRTSCIRAEPQYKSEKLHLSAQLNIGINVFSGIIYNYKQFYSGCRGILLEDFSVNCTSYFIAPALSTVSWLACKHCQVRTSLAVKLNYLISGAVPLYLKTRPNRLLE